MSIADTRQRSPTRLIWSLICAFVFVVFAGGWFADAAIAWGPDFHYGLPTAVLLAVAIALCVVWPDPLPSGRNGASSPIRKVVALLVLGFGLWACVKAVNLMAPGIFVDRPNPLEADMLVVIELGVRRFLAGANPYTLYHVPWEVPLPYGPYLWGWFIIPVTLNADPRVLTLIASLIVPAACIWAGAVCAQDGRFAASGLFAALSAAILLHPSLLRFHLIGHTAVYWPLLLVFAWLLYSERWSAAAVAAGCLVVARTTMVSLLPVLLMFLWHRRLLTGRRLAVLVAAIAIPFLPFLFADPGALWYALYGSYPKVMKEVVWKTTGAHTTIGATGFLLRHGTQRYVELVQVVSMVAVYVAAWRALGRGAQPQPWCALALLTFSMTTLWPVIYVYFDVFMLIASALATSVLASSRPLRHLPIGMAVLFASSGAVVFAACARSPGSAPLVDVGTASAVALKGRGPERAEVRSDGPRTYARIYDRSATIHIPRASRSASVIHVAAKGCSAEAVVQRMEAWLNGQYLGQAVLKTEWTDAAFRASAGTWFYGVNVLELRFTSPLVAAGGGPASTTTEDRQCAAEIDFVKVEP